MLLMTSKFCSQSYCFWRKRYFFRAICWLFKHDFVFNIWNLNKKVVCKKRHFSQMWNLFTVQRVCAKLREIQSMYSFVSQLLNDSKTRSSWLQWYYKEFMHVPLQLVFNSPLLPPWVTECKAAVSKSVVLLAG